MLKIKDYLPFEELREYGFKPWEEWNDGKANIHPSKDAWLLFMEHPDEGGIMYADDDLPMCYIETDPTYRLIYCEAMPCCTYHIGGSDLDIITDTIFKMTRDGVLEIRGE